MVGSKNLPYGSEDKGEPKTELLNPITELE